jgi:hypothetical protein
MNNGKGLHAWIDEMEDLVSGHSNERSSIIEVIQNEQLGKYDEKDGLKLKGSNVKLL